MSSGSAKAKQLRTVTSGVRMCLEGRLDGSKSNGHWKTQHTEDRKHKHNTTLYSGAHHTFKY
jgi:hypothetical protein